MSASIDIGLTSAEMDMSGAPEDVENNEKLPKNLWNVSEHADKPLELRSRNDFPKGAPVDLDDLGDNMDASPVSRSVEDVGKRLKKLRKAVKHIRKRLERTSQENSPDRPGEELENPGGEAVVVPTASRNILEASEMSASMERTHHVKIGHQEAVELTRWSREVPRAFGTTKTLWTMPDTMGNTPGVRRTSAMVVWMCKLKKPGH